MALRFCVHERALIAEHTCGIPECEGHMAIGSIVEITAVGPFSVMFEGRLVHWDYETTMPATLGEVGRGVWLADDHELRKLDGEKQTESITTEETVDA